MTEHLDAVSILPATGEEIGVAADILEDAIAWSTRRGFDSWTPGDFTDPVRWGWARLREAQAAGELYLIRIRDESVATLSLLREDPRFWPDDAGDARYLHRFAVRATHVGRGVGAAALRWADEEVLRTERRFLRLDCLAGNPGIRAYYERAGFRHRMDAEVDGLRFALYERRAHA